MNKIDSGKDWTFEEVENTYIEIEKISKEMFGLATYPNQIEIISTEQMLDAYAANGLPIFYDHWSFGKLFVREQEMYRRGQMGLAYEIVINSNPCVSYLMEENTMGMQALVMAHACFGHNAFFKNNQLFKQWTSADAIIDYLVFAKNYIKDCETRHGAKEVEKILDACHALKYFGVDRYKRPPRLSKEKEEQRLKSRAEYDSQNFNDIWKTVPRKQDDSKEPSQQEKFPKEPEENILYFIEKNAPNLDEWKRELIRIVRKISQYFYPQMLTKTMNEGFAAFVHYSIIYEMYERDLVTNGFMLEFQKNHTNVLLQHPYTQQINPYALGMGIYQDIKRVAMSPTKEDERWFHHDFVGTGDWLAAVRFAMENFKDESFILQYLSPKVMRDFGLMCVLDDDHNPELIVEAIQDEYGYTRIRELLSEQCNVNNLMPNIQVINVDVWGDRSLELVHRTSRRHALHELKAIATLEHLAYLWGYQVRLNTVDETGKNIQTLQLDANRLKKNLEFFSI